MNLSDFCIKLGMQITTAIPGSAARQRMAPTLRGSPPTTEPCKKAAVLILLFPENEEISLVLIRRTSDYGPHSGQISFPGGMAKPGDKTLAKTAIRETMEEIGAVGDDIRIIGQLQELLIPVSNTEVSPFIGYIDYKPLFKPDPREVSYLILVPLNSFIDSRIIKSEQKIIFGQSVEVPYFQINEEKVWGATAMILSEFIEFAEKVVQDSQDQY